MVTGPLGSGRIRRDADQGVSALGHHRHLVGPAGIDPEERGHLIVRRRDRVPPEDRPVGPEPAEDPILGPLPEEQHLGERGVPEHRTEVRPDDALVQPPDDLIDPHGRRYSSLVRVVRFELTLLRA